MKVREIMTRGAINCCSPDTRLASAARMMKNVNRGALPVVDSHNKVVGIVTDRDICLSLAADGSADTRVSKILNSRKVKTVHAEDEVSEVLREMRRNRIGRLPVTDAAGKLKGMISVNNILTHAITHNEQLGSLKSRTENLAKTIKTLNDRNSRTGLPRKAASA